MMFGYKTKANFGVENEAAISKPPAVDFAPPPASAPATTPPAATTPPPAAPAH
jgi:LemA protein